MQNLKCHYDDVIMWFIIDFGIFHYPIVVVHRFKALSLVTYQTQIVTKMAPGNYPNTKISSLLWHHDDVIRWFIIDFWIFNCSHWLCTQIQGFHLEDLSNLDLHKSDSRQPPQYKDIKTVMTSWWRHHAIYWFLNI